LRNRDTTVIYWELLRAMAPGPQLPTRLARTTNIPYDRLGQYLDFLTAGALVKVEPSEGHERYSLTPKGMEALGRLDAGLRLLFPALE
jgi:predicted transcriptional regulator